MKQYFFLDSNHVHILLINNSKKKDKKKNLSIKTHQLCVSIKIIKIH